MPIIHDGWKCYEGHPRPAPVHGETLAPCGCPAQVVADRDAFAQMQRFVHTTGRTLLVEIEKDTTHIANHDYEFFAATGWDGDDGPAACPEIAVRANTFAAAWEKFCGYWPEAAKS